MERPRWLRWPWNLEEQVFDEKTERVPGRDAILIEYQKAQDSAEHHDGRVANVTNLWVGTAILMGFVLSALTTGHAAHDHRWVLFLIALVGIALTVMAWIWSERANALKKLKYQRCQFLEEQLGLRQNRMADKPPSWQGDYAYRILIALFIAAWIGLLVGVFRAS
jgi:MFS family permease